MNPEESLLAYLYPRLVEALQTWKGFDDIYGIWVGILLYEDNPARPSINVIGCLRENSFKEEEIQKYGSRWAPVFMAPSFSFKPGLCDDPWPDEDEDPMHYDHESLYLGDPEGRALREAFFAWKQAQPETPTPINQDDADDFKFSWFLEVGGRLIRQLHDSGTIADVCGHPVPIAFGIGDGGTVTLAMVQDNNPPGLAEGMLAWMRGG